MLFGFIKAVIVLAGFITLFMLNPIIAIVVLLLTLRFI